MKSECILCKSDHDFILVFNNNHTSIMHSFRFNRVYPLAGNDVIVLSPLAGADSNLLGWILGGGDHHFILVLV